VARQGGPKLVLIKVLHIGKKTLPAGMDHCVGKKTKWGVTTKIDGAGWGTWGGGGKTPPNIGSCGCNWPFAKPKWGQFPYPQWERKKTGTTRKGIRYNMVFFSGKTRHTKTKGEREDTKWERTKNSVGGRGPTNRQKPPTTKKKNPGSWLWKIGVEKKR